MRRFCVLDPRDNRSFEDLSSEEVSSAFDLFLLLPNFKEVKVSLKGKAPRAAGHH
jgi:hypothetical protein